MGYPHYYVIGGVILGSCWRCSKVSIECKETNQELKVEASRVCQKIEIIRDIYGYSCKEREIKQMTSKERRYSHGGKKGKFNQLCKETNLVEVVQIETVRVPEAANEC